MSSSEKAVPLGAVAKNAVEDSVRRARLLWRAKRGLLENDIVMTRFFDAYPNLSDEQVYGLDLLLDLSDDELFCVIGHCEQATVFVVPEVGEQLVSRL